MSDTILKMERISKSFMGVRVLNEVSLCVKKGEVYALVGENGAGKSTLMKILLGIYVADSGTVEFNGKKVNFHSPSEALRSGISMIHQEISLVPTLDVAENIWLGQERRFLRAGLIDSAARYEATRALLDKIGIDLNPRTLIRNMSIASMQLVELVRAVSYDSELIIMDEPTSALTSNEIETLYRIVSKLRDDGKSILFISHKLDEIYRICDRMSVLRDGNLIGTKGVNEIGTDELICMIAGREMKEIYPKKVTNIGRTVLEVKSLSSTGVFEDISFSVRAGEIVGFSGLMGAGRTEIMRALFGIDPHTSGDILIDGKSVDIRSPKDAVRRGIGMVTEDRLRTGAVHTMSVMGNATLTVVKEMCRALWFFSKKSERTWFDNAIKSQNIRFKSADDLISTLSGGNQQKVIIARWLLKNSNILILDEPTRGIDVGAKYDVYRIMEGLAAKGIAILMISSEMPEILAMCDKIFVVRGGRIVYECQAQGTTQEELASYAFGMQTRRQSI